MGLFGLGRQGADDGLQRPDALAMEAAEHYRAGDPEKALKLYVKAIHELHKMYIRGKARKRQPGPGDDAILNGVRDALRASMAAKPDADFAGEVAWTVAPLVEIGQTAGEGEIEGAGRYFTVVNDYDAILATGKRWIESQRANDEQ
jgi:hypothetical protein